MDYLHSLKKPIQLTVALGSVIVFKKPKNNKDSRKIVLECVRDVSAELPVF